MVRLWQLRRRSTIPNNRDGIRLRFGKPPLISRQISRPCFIPSYSTNPLRCAHACVVVTANSKQQTANSKQRKRLSRRRLLIESLEQRRLLASGDWVLTLTQSHATIYEDGAINSSNMTLTLDGTLTDQNNPTFNGGVITSGKMTVTGQVDAYALNEVSFVGGEGTMINAELQEFNTTTDGQTFGGSFELAATQDETISIPITVPGSDTKDWSDDTITITVEIVYDQFKGYDDDENEIWHRDKEVSVSTTTTIVDNADSPPPDRSVTLADDDAEAEEPHAVYYLPGPVDNGNATVMTFPATWPSGTISIGLAGTATPGSDYGLGLRAEPVGAAVVLTGSGVNRSLFVPAGVTKVFIDVIPVGDLLEPGFGDLAMEDVLISVEPNNQEFIGSDGGTITVSGTATVDITDVLEGLSITATPETTEEFRTEAPWAAFHIQPDLSGVLMRGDAYLRIDATKSGSATPGVDYSLKRRNGSPLLVFATATPGIFHTEMFSVHGLNELFIDAIPVNDMVLEGEEDIDARLMTTPRYSGDTGDHGDAKITITEEYYNGEQEPSPSPDPTSSCNCSCSCPGTVKIDKESGNVSVSSLNAGDLGYQSPGQDSQHPNLRIKLALPDGKAAPTFVALTIDAVNPDFDANGNPIGLGRTVASRVMQEVGIVVSPPQFSESDPSERYVWLTVQPDLSAAAIAASNSTGPNQGILNLEILAHPVFAANVPTEDRFSGWLGRHTQLLTDASKSSVSAGGAPGLRIPGVDRAIPNATILVGQSSGSNGRTSGRVVRQSGFALFRSNGSTAWFKDGTVPPPNTLSSLAGNTLTTRDGSKNVFNAAGQMTQSIDPQGNITQLAYDGFGRVLSITDAIGRRKSFAYFEGASAATSAMSNRIRVTAPGQQVTWFEYNRATGVLEINHPDVDGTGPLPHLAETWTYAGGMLSGITTGSRTGQTGAVAAAKSTAFTFSNSLNPTSPLTSPGDRRIQQVSYSTGGVMRLVRSRLSERVITASSSPRVLTAQNALMSRVKKTTEMKS